MNVVLRTPNGEAEITVVGVHHDLTLGDLVDRVTGRAAPTIVYVDGRAVPSETPVGTSSALDGSIISTVGDDVAADGVVELVQIAGTGGGSRVWLTAGRYRIGVGRRVNADELDMAQVEVPRLELDVTPSGAVTVRSFDVRARLDGAVLDSDRPADWTAGSIDVGGRVFTLGRRQTTTGGHRFAGSIDGTATFNRPPRVPARAELPPLDASGARASDRAAFSAAVADRHVELRNRLRSEQPDLAGAVEIAERANPELWQRRADHPDAFQLPIGLADLEWSPDLERVQRVIPEAQAIVDDLGPVPMVPVVVDLLRQRALGIVGSPEFNEAVTRGLLLEAAVLHGPADLDVVVMTSASRIDAWEWTKWLPHVRRGTESQILTTIDDIRAWSVATRRGWAAPTRPSAPTHLTLVVVDEPDAWRDRTAPLRPLLAEPALPARFVVLTGTAVDVPAVCTTMVSEQTNGRARLDDLMDRRRVDDVIPFVASRALSQRTARRLAPLDDPDVSTLPETALPPSVAALELLGLVDPSADAIEARWARRATDVTRGPVAPIGAGEHGPVRVDLVESGPHALVAGTNATSELLRTLVLGLAADSPPDQINFVIVNGVDDDATALDACVRLPHTVGVVDAGDPLALSRVLRGLRAELRHREELMADAGASSFNDVARRQDSPTIARLVIVVAELGALGGFTGPLLDIVQRGGDLGVHGILATKRPAAVLDDAASTLANVRVALQVRNDGDSVAVVGGPEAARLPGRLPGRGVARFGDDELIAFQAPTSWGPPSTTPSNVRVEPFAVGRELTPMESRLVRREADASPAADADIERLVGAIVDAAADQPAPRRPILDPLAERLALDDFFSEHPGDAIPYGLVDLPDQRAQPVTWWTPGPEANLLVYGSAGSAAASLLATLAIGVAERHASDDVHLYVIDNAANSLAPLRALPHVGAVVRLGETERLLRLIAHLSDVIVERMERARDAASAISNEPSIVVMINDFGALRHQLEPRRDAAWDQLRNVIADGRAAGVTVVIVADQERAVPPSILGRITDRLVLQLAGPNHYTAFGLDGDAVAFEVPGRAVRLSDTAEVQLVEPPADLAAAIAALDCEAAIDRPVVRIDVLPSSVAIADVMDEARRRSDRLVVPIGLDTRTARPAMLELPFGEHAVVTGPPGSGRSSVLVACAVASAQVDPPIPVFAMTPRGGPLAGRSEVDGAARSGDLGDWIERIVAASGPRLVLVDDADRLGGPDVGRLAAIDDDEVIVVIAGRNEELRSASHWSRRLRPFGRGVLLRPGVDHAMVLGLSLGSRVPTFAPHTGLIVVDDERVPVIVIDGSVT